MAPENPRGTLRAVKFFDPQPAASELPNQLANPFAEGPPHPLARRAADAVRRRLEQGDLPAGVDLGGLRVQGRGKMFGVLVFAAPEGRVGYLSAFSGMLDERWLVEGFAPPLFDPAARDAFWPEVEAELRRLQAELAELADGAEARALRTRLAGARERHAREASGLRARHQAMRHVREQARAQLANAPLPEQERRAALAELARQSRDDDLERRHLAAAHREERGRLVEPLRALDLRRGDLDRSRAAWSRQLWRRMGDSYRVPNGRGEVRTMSSLFAPAAPPGGAGDCAAPKLLAEAYRRSLTPLALAEFWWGAPPLTGGRTAGEFYPACRSKCGGVLPFMLEGANAGPLDTGAAPPPPG